MLLEVKKIDIIDFAHKVGIPYLYDSTPKWSRRGRMRDQLFPFLQNFDPGLLNGLEIVSDALAHILPVYTEATNSEHDTDFLCAKVKNEKNGIHLTNKELNVLIKNSPRV